VKIGDKIKFRDGELCNGVLMQWELEGVFTGEAWEHDEHRGGPASIGIFARVGNRSCIVPFGAILEVKE
jgi:hypothetical protein